MFSISLAAATRGKSCLPTYEWNMPIKKTTRVSWFPGGALLIVKTKNSNAKKPNLYRDRRKIPQRYIFLG